MMLMQYIFFSAKTICAYVHCDFALLSFLLSEFYNQIKYYVALLFLGFFCEIVSYIFFIEYAIVKEKFQNF